MKRRTSTDQLYIISILLFGYYLFIAHKLFFAGVYSNEGLFFAEKGALLVEGNSDSVKLMGLTFPQVPFMLTFLFSIFNSTFAPFVTSAVGTAALFFIIIRSIREYPNSSWLFLGVLLTFVFHPAFIFIAVSGKSAYLCLIFFYLFISSLFRYFHSNTSYHISVASIYFALLIFCWFKFVWLTLFLLPVIFFAALQSMQILQNEPLDKIAFAFNKISVRRKLVNKTLAVYLIIFLLPLVAIFIFRLLNLSYTGDANYYIDSPYANYTSIINQTENFNGFPDIKFNSVFPEVNFLITIRILLFAPLLLICLGMHKSMSRNVMVVFALFFLMEFLKMKYPGVYIPIQFYALFICVCWAIILNSRNTRIFRYTKQFYLVLILLQIITGYLLTSSSLIPEERKYINAITSMLMCKPIDVDDDKVLSDAIKKIDVKKGILSDDATSYRVIALTGSANCFLTPGEGKFLAAFGQPQDNVSYVLISKEQNPFNGFGLLDQHTLISWKNKGIRLKRVVESRNWELYAITK
ncbi:hypothetical protein [Pedobacter sp. Leaf250]|uniref:hypothetical protein n=1 Tax=Pedobacter sp. Leaf250 TaxID=2876559 RepID=UPI001E303720|nr:hypothetical protein [Pedobacter sp. Leaf250]